MIIKSFKHLTNRVSLIGLCLAVTLLAACDQLDGLDLDAQIVSFTANPSSIEAGESATLSWNILGGPEDLEVSLMPGNVELERTGEYQVTPQETTTYTLSAGSEGASVTKSVTLQVGDASLPEGEIACESEDALITFKDTFFEGAVRRNLEEQGVETNPEGVSCAQMAALTTLGISSDPEASLSPDGPITDLSGIEYAANLLELSLGNVSAPLDPLASLRKLEALYVSGYLPDDLTALSDLPNLKGFFAFALPFGDNDMSVLNDVPKLELMTLIGGNDGYPGTVLDFGNIDLPNLMNLTVEGVQLKNPQGLKALTSLSELSLDYVVDTEDKLAEIKVSDEVVKTVSELTNLEALSLSGDSIYDLEERPEVKNFAPLANLKNLTSLDLSNQGVTDLSFAAALTQIAVLKLSSNRISDIAPLLELPWTADFKFVDIQNQSATAPIPAAQIEALSKVVKVFYSEENVGASDLSLTLQKDTSVNFDLPESASQDVVFNIPYDLESDIGAVDKLFYSGKGSLTGYDTGDITYTPPPGFVGTKKLAYTLVRLDRGNVSSEEQKSVTFDITEQSVGQDVVSVTSLEPTGEGSLQQAILDVAPGGTVTVDESISGGTLSTDRIVFGKDLTFIGNLKLDRFSTARYILEVKPNATVLLKNIEVSRGILNEGSLALEDAVLSGIDSSYSGGGDGSISPQGAVVTSGALTLQGETEITENSRGVLVQTGGSLTLKDAAKIYGNTGLSSFGNLQEGGGVRVQAGGTLTGAKYDTGDGDNIFDNTPDNVFLESGN